MQGDNLLLKSRKKRKMLLHKAGTRHGGKPDLVQGFSQPLRGGPSCPALGIASEESRDLLARRCQSGTHDPLQDRDHPQGNGKAGT